MTLLNKYIGKTNFRVGLGYTRFDKFEPNNSILLDQTYFNVSFFNVEYRYSAELNYERIMNPIPFEYCNDSFSDFVEDEVRERFSIETHICPSTTDFYLVGDLNSRVYRDIEIFIAPWNENNNNGVVWKPREEIDFVLNTGFINAPITISYFDFDDYVNPVKTILAEPDDHYLLNNATTWIEYFVRENTAMTSDNLFFNEPF